MTIADDMELSRNVMLTLKIDVETAAIVSDAISSLMRLAEARGVPTRMAIANACAQAIMAMAENSSEQADVQRAASLVALMLDERLELARGCAMETRFVASAAAKGQAS